MILRRLLVAVALVVLVTACSEDGDTPLTAEPGSEGTPQTQPTGTDTSSAPSTDGAPTTSAAPGEPTTTSQPPSTTGAPDTADRPAPDVGPVGGFAAFYLRPDESDQVLVDVHSQAGAEPRSATLDHLVSVLGQVSGKSVSVSRSAVGGGGQRWTAQAIRDLADSVSPAQSRDRSVLTLLYLRGEFADGENVVGVAVRSDVAAVFGDKVAEAAGVLGNPAAVEDAVSMHEIGHILGLVDLVLETGRQDPEHPGHSPNRESVMYYAVESTLIGTILEGGPPRDFDRADLDDLARIRNG